MYVRIYVYICNKIHDEDTKLPVFEICRVEVQNPMGRVPWLINPTCHSLQVVLVRIA